MYRHILCQRSPLEAQRITILGRGTVYLRKMVPADLLGTDKVGEHPKKVIRLHDIRIGYLTRTPCGDRVREILRSQVAERV